MRIASFFAVLTLLTMPTLASAECSWGMGHEVTMSCAEGTTWDADSMSCLPTVSS